MENTPPTWPFSERDSTLAESAIEMLQANSEEHLSSQEKLDARAFAQQLFDGPGGPEGKDLEVVRNINAASGRSTFYLDYFDTDEGRQACTELGLRAGGGTEVIKELYAAAARGTKVPPAARRAVANNSQDWYTARLEQQLAGSAEHDADFENSPTGSVNFSPEKTLDKFEELQKLRTYYRQLNIELHTAPSHSPALDAARKTLLQVHIAKVNSMTASLYPSIVQLGEQLTKSPQTVQVAQWQARLFAIAPVVRLTYREGVEARSAPDFIRRLDLIRNGAQDVQAGDFSPISNAVQALATEIEQGVGREARP